MWSQRPHSQLLFPPEVKMIHTHLSGYLRVRMTSELLPYFYHLKHLLLLLLTADQWDRVFLLCEAFKYIYHLEPAVGVLRCRTDPSPSLNCPTCDRCYRCSVGPRSGAWRATSAACHRRRPEPRWVCRLQEETASEQSVNKVKAELNLGKIDYTGVVSSPPINWKIKEKQN